MALKSIVEIDIDDTKFKEWLATAHKLTIGINAPTGATTSAPSSSSATTSATTTSDIKFNAEKEKQHKAEKEKQHKKDKKEWSETDTHRKQESKSRKDSLEGLKNFTSSVGSFSASLAKWSLGIGTGVVAGAGFGYMRGARETQDEFRRSKELGVNVGQMKALQDTLSPLLDVNTTLANFAEAATSTLKNVSLNLLPQEERLSKTPAEMMLSMIPRLKAELTKVGANDISLQQYMEANKLTDLFSMDAIKSLKNNSNEFINTLLQLAQSNVKALNLTDKQQEDYAKLNTAFTLEMDKFTQDLKRLTVELTPEISSLITSFSTFASDAMRTGTFKESIVALGDGIKGVADYISSGKLLQALKDFENGLKGVNNFFGFTKESEFETTPKENLKLSASGEALAKEKAPMLAELEKQYGLPSGYLNDVISYESGWNPKAKNPESTAEGLGQFTKATQKTYGLTDPTDVDASIIATARYASDAMKKWGDLSSAQLYYYHHEGLSKTGTPSVEGSEGMAYMGRDKVNEFTKNNEITKNNEFTKNNEINKLNEFTKNNEFTKVNKLTKSGEPNAAITLTEGMVDISSAFISSILMGITDLASNSMSNPNTNMLPPLNWKDKVIQQATTINLNVTSQIPANYNATGATVASQVRGQ